tara:strand:+ start:106 stop:1461 length:1356 start_codon:yes stop_codon:yes gene_type:complete
MNIKVFFIENDDLFLEDELENIDLVKDLIQINGFSSKSNEIIFLPGECVKDYDSALLVGLEGCSNNTDYLNIGLKIGKSLSQDVKLTFANLKKINLYYIEFGVYLSQYSFDQFKTEQQDLINIEIKSNNNSDEIKRKIESVFWVRDLVNYPSKTKSPEFFIEKVEELISNLEINLTIHDDDWLRKNNFGGVIGVGQGSERKPKFLIGEFNPNAKMQIALIGKGVLFDSGGLSLKSPTGMETMKTDMTGAATAWGVMSLVAKQKLDIGLKVYTPLVENMPSGTAIRPGDVLTMRNNKTIEVLNTDAEGRLIMADALAYASEHNPDLICDVATLTGASYVALGLDIGAVFSNDDETLKNFLSANKDSHEKYHDLPLEESYKSLIKSVIADMKNTGGRFGGAITAALLLKEFVDDIKWIHLDIAGPARSKDSKSATGFGTIGLYNFFESFTKNL